jgi:hypothetical protein
VGERGEERGTIKGVCDASINEGRRYAGGSLPSTTTARGESQPRLVHVGRTAVGRTRGTRLTDRALGGGLCGGLGSSLLRGALGGTLLRRALLGCARCGRGGGGDRGRSGAIGSRGGGFGGRSGFGGLSSLSGLRGLGGLSSLGSLRSLGGFRSLGGLGRRLGRRVPHGGRGGEGERAGVVVDVVLGEVARIERGRLDTAGEGGRARALDVHLHAGNV